MTYTWIERIEVSRMYDLKIDQELVDVLNDSIIEENHFFTPLSLSEVEALLRELDMAPRAYEEIQYNGYDWCLVNLINEWVCDMARESKPRLCDDEDIGEGWSEIKE